MEKEKFSQLTCPYCGKELLEKHCYRTDFGVIEESLHLCPDGHYAEDYAYGGYMVQVCGWDFGWSDVRPKELDAQIKAICEVTKKLKGIAEMEKEKFSQLNLFCPLSRESCKGPNCGFYDGQVCGVAGVSFTLASTLMAEVVYLNKVVGDMRDIAQDLRDRLVEGEL